MKQKIFLLFLLFCTDTLLFAQKPPVIKVYAYSQAILPGTRRVNTVDESGKEIKGSSERKISYFIYVEQKRSTVINIISVWINGKNYTANTDTVSQTPIETRTGDPANTVVTLVPKSFNTILLITPGSEKLPVKKPASYLKKSIASSELVIVYEWKGKFWYSEVKKIKELKPLAAV